MIVLLGLLKSAINQNIILRIKIILKMHKIAFELKLFWKRDKRDDTNSFLLNCPA